MHNRSEIRFEINTVDLRIHTAIPNITPPRTALEIHNPTESNTIKCYAQIRNRSKTDTTMYFEFLSQAKRWIFKSNATQISRLIRKINLQNFCSS
ncbi:hypothetical protein LguiB_031519 [Lonicera macranthoides]